MLMHMLSGVVLACGLGAAEGLPEAPARGCEALGDILSLPLLPQGMWSVVTDSHDVHGYNDDGFSGNYSFLYKRDGESVIFEEEGPGCVYEIRTIGFQGNLRVYLDGASEPQLVIPFPEVYAGQKPPFVAPFVAPESAAHGSSWSYVPIPFAKGCRIATDAEKNHFFNVFAQKFAAGTPVTTFNPDRVDLAKAAALWSDPAAGPPLPARTKTLTGTLHIDPLGRASLIDMPGAGAILRMRLRLPGKPVDRAGDLLLKGHWDEAVVPQVDTPLSTFFALGCPRALAAARHADPTLIETERYKGGFLEPHALPVGVDADGRLYCHLPMPYWKSARLDVLNRSERDAIDIEYEIAYTETPYPANAGYLHARWRQESPLRPAEDFCILDTRGHGRYLGCVATFSSVLRDAPYGENVVRAFLEGDARFYIDENRTPQVASTGTEEYFNWGWYDMRPHDEIFHYPTHGYPLHVVENQSHSVMYRFHIGEAVPYYRSFRFDLEHGPEGRVPAHYSATAFYYQRDEAALAPSDMIDVGDPASEEAHAYKCDGSSALFRRVLPYEGSYQIPITPDTHADRPGAVRDDGRAWTGSCSFSVAVNENNAGVKLRRRSFYAPEPIAAVIPAQRVSVAVDGVEVGDWFLPERNARLAWLDTDFEIPASFTAGKTRLNITLTAKDGTVWDEYTYWVYSYIEPERKP